MGVASMLWLVCGSFGPCLASPSIQWSGLIEQHIGMGPGEYFTPIDFDKNGVVDIIFRTYETTMYLAPLNENEIVATSGLFVDQYRPITAGTLIDQNLELPLLWQSGEQTILSYMVVEQGEVVGGGSWYDVDHGLLGVSFYIGADLHYGWVRMSENDETLTIHDWAFVTQAGVGINAGVVPEPSTMGIFILGSMTLFLRLRNTRRKQVAEQGTAHVLRFRQ